MLDQYHWEKPDAHFLALMESGALTIADIRELTWAQLRNSYEGLFIRDIPVNLRPDYLDEIRALLKDGKGFYGEELYGEGGSPRLFSKETLKNITKELDQFKG